MSSKWKVGDQLVCRCFDHPAVVGDVVEYRGPGRANGATPYLWFEGTDTRYPGETMAYRRTNFRRLKSTPTASVPVPVINIAAPRATVTQAWGGQVPPVSVAATEAPHPDPLEALKSTLKLQRPSGSPDYDLGYKTALKVILAGVYNIATVDTVDFVDIPRRTAEEVSPVGV